MTQMQPALQHAIGPQAPLTPPAEPPGLVASGLSKNLIGNTAASAYVLRDPGEQLGIYFIFNDLSVRTEDWFRLKCSVFDIGDTVKGLSQEALVRRAQANNAAPSEYQPGDPLTKRGSKCLDGLTNSFIDKQGVCVATAFTDCFKVYSPKKFPGVADSTALSKCFAQQGVKISIRKDNEKEGKRAKRKRSNQNGDGDNGVDGDDDSDE